MLLPEATCDLLSLVGQAGLVRQLQEAPALLQLGQLLVRQVAPPPLAQLLPLVPLLFLLPLLRLEVLQLEVQQLEEAQQAELRQQAALRRLAALGRLAEPRPLAAPQRLAALPEPTEPLQVALLREEILGCLL